ncbi:trans-sulfuration enzyme family protein [Phnomibacter ginsenosidimutans]|uniref:Aminotransferase class I/II-fold pyridoxal phosphate-dependent enzyme n=1 Tax=Phnomibacter ginsenosidimutans TaxID=2676868 RepID=A0A6I6G7F0_9BACT|nr:aminotransferase class I/II-fold pyridoxal phosphate-dependent enzyme [Phnomibacter ginsenosidimutans]QGW27413.1 aminotransferase class I/II-fold pyridoxal phosphate-dependent enzyme [Phnomibacter ginsenosidimutans]
MADKNFPLSGWSSAAIHAGHEQDPNSSHITPIYATSTFVFDTAEEGMERFASLDKEKVYSRWGNPTFKECEQKIAALEAFGLSDENGQPLELKALLHASGQAAMATLFFSTLKAGDKVLSHHSLYGGTYELLHKVLANSGIEPIIEDLHDLEKAEEWLQKDDSIKLIHIETPANPTIRCVDIEALTQIAKRYGKLVSVDNTFATPYLQQPFAYGVDFVFHSTTKFLNGHGSAIGGVLIGKDIHFMKTTAWKWHALLGGNANPFDAYLLTQGIKTLELRMERHCHNAMEVAQFLDGHPNIEHVNYTGLHQHPDYYISAKQMRHPGPMMSFELKGGLEAGKQFINRLKMCTRAVSLGTVDTLLSHPASMSHAGLSRENRLLFGITDGLIRMSVGIENVQDIIADLDQALRG